MTFKRMILTSALSLIALPALAGSQPPPGSPPVSIGGSIALGTNANQQSGVNSAISTGQIGSNSRARSTSQATGGLGGQGGSAAGGTSRVVNNIGNGSGGLMGSQPDSVTVRSAPNANAPAIFGANSCSEGASASGSWIATGFGLGLLWDGDECRKQEWYRLYSLNGDPVAAMAAACLVRSQRRMFQEIGRPCPQDVAKQQASVPSQPVQPVAMNPSTARDPRPSVGDCTRLRALRDPTQVQRDYLVNCG